MNKKDYGQMGIAATFFAAILFGLWQENVFAGMFLFLLVCALDLLTLGKLKMYWG